MNLSLLLHNSESREVVELSYSLNEIPASAQARFAGRAVLVPTIDWSEFTCRAVIDWIDISFSFGRRTQHQWLSDAIATAVGLNCYVEPLNAEEGGVSALFRVRFQEPNLRIIRQLYAALDGTFGLVGEPEVCGLELSVDFTPNEPCARSRALMYGVLTRHFWTAVDLTTSPLDRMRVVSGSGRRVRYVLARQKRASAAGDDELCISGTKDVAAQPGATMYAGSKNGMVQWRIMDKVLDRQNRSAGTFKLLPDEEKRVRIEVTLGKSELRACGIQRIEDLTAISMTTMQGRYFRFMLPTFKCQVNSPASRQQAMDAWWARLEIQKFFTTGVMGLSQLEAVHTQMRARMRKACREDFRRRKLRMSGLPRVGNGQTGNLIAFQELNEMVRCALRSLGKRLGRQMRE